MMICNLSRIYRYSKSIQLSLLTTRFNSIHTNNTNINTTTTTTNVSTNTTNNTNNTTTISPGSAAWSKVHSQHYQSLNPIQTAVLTVSASILALTNTERGDLIAVLSETLLTENILQQLKSKLESTEEGRYILYHKPRILITDNSSSSSSISADYSNYPINSFGYYYYQFLSTNQYNPNDRTINRFINNTEYSYIIQRYREIHDFLHILYNLPVTVEGELLLKQLESRLLYGLIPMTAITSIIGSIVKLSFKQKYRLLTKYTPYCIAEAKKFGNNNSNNNNNNNFILSIYWEQYFSMNLDELRKLFNITPFKQQ